MENMNLEKTIDRTEMFLEEQKEIIPKEVLLYLKEVIKQDREYIKMMKQWGEQKGILKKPEAKAIKYQKGLKRP
jgi:hypothetical protein